MSGAPNAGTGPMPFLVATMLIAGIPATALATTTGGTGASLTDRILEASADGTDGTTEDATDGGSQTETSTRKTEVSLRPPYERDGDMELRLRCGTEGAWVERVMATPQPDGSETVVTLFWRCVDLIELATDGNPPAMTDDIAGELVRRELPLPTARMNPSAYAVTQVETWVWYADDGSLSMTFGDHDGNAATPDTYYATVTASDAAGFNTVTATVWISEYRWDMGDGTVIRSATPGSAESPAGEHLYTATSDENVVTASTVWAGTWSSTAGGIANGNGTLGPVVVTGAPTDYPVYQVRSAPVGRR